MRLQSRSLTVIRLHVSTVELSLSFVLLACMFDLLNRPFFPFSFRCLCSYSCLSILPLVFALSWLLFWFVCISLWFDSWFVFVFVVPRSGS